MISQEDLSVRMHEKVQEVPGKKGLLTKHLWRLLKNLFIGILYQIISEEYEKWQNDNGGYKSPKPEEKYPNW